MIEHARLRLVLRGGRESALLPLRAPAVARLRGGTGRDKAQGHWECKGTLCGLLLTSLCFRGLAPGEAGSRMTGHLPLSVGSLAWSSTAGQQGAQLLLRCM